MFSTQFLTMQEAAKMLNISKSAIYRLKDEEPDFPVVKLGGSYRIPESKLEKWVLDRCPK